MLDKIIAAKIEHYWPLALIKSKITATLQEFENLTRKYMKLYTLLDQNARELTNSHWYTGKVPKKLLSALFNAT